MDATGEGNLTVVTAFIALRLEAGWRRQTIDSRAICNLATKSRKALASEEATGEAMEALVANG